jgi:hypothetical protein
MSKLPGEQGVRELVEQDYFLFLFPTGQSRLTLTSHRVRYGRSDSGSGELRSIMLEEVSACMMTHSSLPILLFLAVLFALLAVLLTIARQIDTRMMVVGVGIGAVMLIFYLLSRQRVLRIGSAGGEIIFSMRGVVDITIVQAFIDELELAKNDRYLLGRVAVAKMAEPY